jgi:hypothetical protein
MDRASSRVSDVKVDPASSIRIETIIESTINAHTKVDYIA